MISLADQIEAFRTGGADRLLALIRSHSLLTDERAEAVAHALADIADSLERVYGDLLPKILQDAEAPRDLVQDRLWEIREEFRHIDYHIRDGELTDL